MDDQVFLGMDTDPANARAGLLAVQGLGLALAKRLIQQFHPRLLFVKPPSTGIKAQMCAVTASGAGPRYQRLQRTPSTFPVNFTSTAFLARRTFRCLP